MVVFPPFDIGENERKEKLMQSNFPDGSEVAFAALPIIIGVVVLGIFLAIAIVICLLISNCFRMIPQEFREMEPGMFDEA